jgi:hypothetical protein
MSATKSPNEVSGRRVKTFVLTVTINNLIFPYIEFYDTKKFLKQIYAIAKWADYAVNYEDINKIKKLHKEFLLRQPYTNAKNNCDALINLYIKNALKKFPEMSVIEEAYIESKVNKIIF